MKNIKKKKALGKSQVSTSPRQNTPHHVGNKNKKKQRQTHIIVEETTFIGKENSNLGKKTTELVILCQYWPINTPFLTNKGVKEKIEGWATRVSKENMITQRYFQFYDIIVKNCNDKIIINMA